MSVKLQLQGFDDYLKKLRKAGADVQKITENAILKSGAIVNSNLENQINSDSRMNSETKKRILDDMIPPTITHSSDRVVTGQAGIRIGSYPKTNEEIKNLSGGFIALFNEYGTKYRKTKKGARRGSLEKLEFTQRALKKSAPKIRKLQKGILEEALKELEK